MDTLFQDLRYAARALRRSPGFTLAAVLTLALGIGANTTIFSAANAFLLRPVNAEHPERVVRVYRNEHSPLSYREYRYVREHNTSLAGIVGERNATLAMNAPTGNERVYGMLVSGDYFRVLGVPAARGRTFDTPDAAAPGAYPEVVLSHRFWRRRFGGDPGVVGSTIRLNTHPYAVVGVAKQGYDGAYLGYAPDLWVPLAESRPLTGTDLAEVGGSMYVTARLKPGVSRQQAAGNLAALAAQLTRLDPSLREPVRLRVDSARGINAELRTPALAASAMLLAVVGLVLLIACANLSNLLLARGMSRSREIAIRLSLGAKRARLVRQLLTESVLLALAGGALALVITLWTTDLLLGFLPQDLPIAVDLSPDRRVLAYTLLVSLGTSLLFGLVPALRASSPELVGALKDDTPGHRRSRLRGALVVGEVTLCMVLLGGSALFLRSLANARHIDPGFRPEHVLDLGVDLGLRQYSEERGREFYHRLAARAESLPGVRSAAVVQVVPLSGSNMETSFALPGDDPNGRRTAYFNVIGPKYFATVGTPVLRGRELAEGEADAVVVNETFVRRTWPGADALGKRLDYGGKPMTVVGVTRDAKYVSLGEEPRPTLYLPHAGAYNGEMTLLVRTSGDPAALARPLAAAAQSLDPSLPLPRPKTMTEEMELSLMPARFGAALLGVFGGLALLLATVGIYGVVSYSVVQRTREIGIRAALGASREALLRMVVGGSMRLVGIGLATGLALAVLFGVAASGLLYGVSPADPALLVGAPAVLALAALLASYLPARRATRVDPMIALRAD
ncbi:MAG: ABC transporter permease [Gemmatimonadetes bacterium]|nr:ABC transporter permease [Gemmatimonadota bacterium]